MTSHELIVASAIAIHMRSKRKTTYAGIPSAMAKTKVS
jgi:hypothetical protein